MSIDPEEIPRETLQRVAEGDERAFAAVVSATKRPLFGLIRRYVGEEAEALDLLQETYAAAWTAIGRYDPSRPILPWLRRVALNKCRDWSRRRAVRRWLSRLASLDHPGAQAAADPAPDGETILADQQAARALERALAELPPQLKEPLLLTALDGLSHKEAGEVLGISPKAVETRIYRAKASLSATMSRLGHDLD